MIFRMNVGLENWATSKGNRYEWFMQKLTLIFVLLELQRIIGAAVNLPVQLMAIRWTILGHGKIQWLLINFIVCTMATI